jgi:hypothetical protein
MRIIKSNVNHENIRNDKYRHTIIERAIFHFVNCIIYKVYTLKQKHESGNCTVVFFASHVYKDVDTYKKITFEISYL